MPTDTPDHTSPENTYNGSPTTADKRTRNQFPTVREWYMAITNPLDLAVELMRRVNINKELEHAGIEPSQEDRLTLIHLCHEWDRLRAIRMGGNPQRIRKAQQLGRRIIQNRTGA